MSLPPAKVLPPDAAKLLQQAAQTPLNHGAPEPDLERRIAIDKATEWVKRHYPQFFKQEVKGNE